MLCTQLYQEQPVAWEKIPPPWRRGWRRVPAFTARKNLPRLSEVSARSLDVTTDERITKLLLPPFTHLRLGYEHNNVANHKVLAASVIAKRGGLAPLALSSHSIRFPCAKNSTPNLSESSFR
jgi:hypothetical protein